MPAFSLTTPKKPTATETPPTTPSEAKIWAAVRAQPPSAPLRRGSRAELPSPKVGPQIPPPTKAKPSASQAQKKAPRGKGKSKAPSRYNKPPTPSPPTSEADEISVTPRRTPAAPSTPAYDYNYDSTIEVASASSPRTPPPTQRKRKTAASAPSRAPQLATKPPPPRELAHARPKRKAAPDDLTTTYPKLTPSSTGLSSAAAPTSNVDAKAILEALSDVIDSEVTYWKHYLSAVEKTSTSYGEITISRHGNTSSSAPHVPVQEQENENIVEEEDKIRKQKQKQKALIHILETLPLRYRALKMAYACGDDNLDFENVALSDDLQRLLALSQKIIIDEEGEAADELEGWFDSRLFESRYHQKFRDDVLGMDEDIRHLENSRMENLTVLMEKVAELKLVAEEGVLAKDPDDEALKSLIGAMDEMGLSAAGSGSSSPVGLGGRVRMSGVNSEDEWVPE